jgi:hypothetical protein
MQANLAARIEKEVSCFDKLFTVFSLEGWWLLLQLGTTSPSVFFIDFCLDLDPDS